MTHAPSLCKHSKPQGEHGVPWGEGYPWGLSGECNLQQMLPEGQTFTTPMEHAEEGTGPRAFGFLSVTSESRLDVELRPPCHPNTDRFSDRCDASHCSESFGYCYRHVFVSQNSD